MYQLWENGLDPPWIDIMSIIFSFVKCSFGVPASSGDDDGEMAVVVMTASLAFRSGSDIGPPHLGSWSCVEEGSLGWDSDI